MFSVFLWVFTSQSRHSRSLDRPDYCSALGSWVCWRTNWGKEVVKVIQRLKEDQARRDLEERAMGTDDQRRGG